MDKIDRLIDWWIGPDGTKNVLDVKQIRHISEQ